MAKQNRVPRPKAELKRELIEQLDLLRHACEQYDNGMEAMAKYIALNIRVLVHAHGQSRALLDLLGIRPARFLDSAGPINERNVIAEHKLIAIRFEGGKPARYVPKIRAVDDASSPMLSIRFQDWWNNPVIRDADRRIYRRRDLVLNVADTDGGAHVDPGMEQEYMALSRRNSLGWEVPVELLRLTCFGQRYHS